MIKEKIASGGLRHSIIRHVTDHIMNGLWKAGDRIPSESEFMQMYGASRMTVHHALRDLTARGYLLRKTGSGTFVAPPRPYTAEYAHQDIVEEIIERGHTHEAQVLRREMTEATAEQAAEFSIRPGSPLFAALVLHRENGMAIELEERYANPELLPDCMAIDLSRSTVFARLMLVRPYREGNETVRAVLPSDDEQLLLAVEAGSPLLEITRRTWSPEGVVTIARILRARFHAVMRGKVRPAVADAVRF